MRDRSVYLAVKLWKKEDPEDLAYSLIRIPGRSVPRFLVLPEENGKQFRTLSRRYYSFLYGPTFSSILIYDMYGAYTIKITRDAELDLDDDISKSFVEKMSHSLKKRKKGKPVRLIYDRDLPQDLFKVSAEKNETGRRQRCHSRGQIPQP